MLWKYFTDCSAKMLLQILSELSVKWFDVPVCPCHCQTDAVQRCLNINNNAIISTNPDVIK